jgi:heptosyltransferase-2
MKILVRAPNWVGDAVMAIPALEAVRRTHPSDEIAILARPAVADLYLGQLIANKILVYENTGRHGGLSGRGKLVRELRREQFDLALLLQNAFDAAWVAWRAGIPRRIGYARDGRGFLLTQSIAVPKDGEIPRHESHYYLELIRRAGWIETRGEIQPIRLHVERAVHGVARSLLELLTARQNAGRRKDLRCSRIAWLMNATPMLYFLARPMRRKWPRASAPQ